MPPANVTDQRKGEKKKNEMRRGWCPCPIPGRHTTLPSAPNIWATLADQASHVEGAPTACTVLTKPTCSAFKLQSPKLHKQLRKQAHAQLLHPAKASQGGVWGKVLKPLQGLLLKPAEASPHTNIMLFFLFYVAPKCHELPPAQGGEVKSPRKVLGEEGVGLGAWTSASGFVPPRSFPLQVSAVGNIGDPEQCLRLGLW